MPENTENAVQPQVQAAQVIDVEAVARKEREKWQAQLEEERKARAELEAKMARIEEEKKQAELAAMQPDERVQAQIRELKQGWETTRVQSEQERSMLLNKLRAMELLAYKERALRDVGEEYIPELIGGGSEEEIDRAIEMSKATYQRIATRFKEMNTRQEVPAIAAPPPNAAYASMMQGDLPSAVAPMSGVSEPTMSIKDLTSEEAVRSGKYSGELREQLHAMLRSTGGYPGNIGNAPRVWANPTMPAVQNIPMPNGVMQPKGLQTMPAVPAQMDPRSAAMAAITRTRAGQNPAVAGDGRVASAFRETRNYAMATQQNPDAVFMERFANSPPLTGGK